MNTASGPLYYVLMGITPMGPESIRVSTLALHVISTGLVWWLGYRRLGKTVWPWLMALAFYLSPFQLGPALWGHPESLATLLILLALWLHTQGFVAAGSALSAISVTSRQTAIAILGGLGLWDLRERRFLNLALKVTVAGLMLLYLTQHWDGLTPPKFQDHTSINGRTFLASLAMMALALLSWELKLGRSHWRQALLLWPLILAACLAVYNLSGPFERGGFIFSRLDTMDMKYFTLCLSSPLVLSAILTVCATPLWHTPRASLGHYVALIGSSATLAISDVFYIKYIDFYVWPLALAIFAFASQNSTRLTNLARSLITWSAANLLLVSFRY